jgi:Zc3h12a-like Ribonuclease NYN domain
LTGVVFEPQSTTDAQPADAPKASSTKLVPKMPPPVRAPAKRPVAPRREEKHKSHLVVDGSNIATEGRNLPSMAQLEDALDAFVKEHPFNVVTVIVDATFGHRISPKEKRWYEEAISTGGMITPPAGAIGRGDAFILEVARRADAVVLSNDSFQEFHGAHPWLFEEGRLYGGKPIPHVGWVFVPRAPVRGATSRRAVRTAK